MAQFTYYTGSDAGAPPLSGSSGSLLAVLDACLVNGYGSKPGAGWTKPFVNSGNIGVYRQGTGSLMFLRVGDNALTTSREARMTGYETMSSINVGINPFPNAAQGVAGAAGIARKSATITTELRAWKVYADSSSFYMFAATGDVAGTYMAFHFGDYYSFATGADTYKAMIVSRVAENNAATANDSLDILASIITNNVVGHFASHYYGGEGASIGVNVHGDSSKGSTTILAGNLNFPNITDSGIYLSPLWVSERSANTTFRGKMKGFYQVLHAVGNFTDGQQFSGSGDYSSKIFEIVKSSGNAGVYCIEISNTLDAN